MLQITNFMVLRVTVRNWQKDNYAYPEKTWQHIRGFFSALEVFFKNDMRYINSRFTYLLTYLPHLHLTATVTLSVRHLGVLAVSQERWLRNTLTLFWNKCKPLRACTEKQAKLIWLYQICGEYWKIVHWVNKSLHPKQTRSRSIWSCLHSKALWSCMQTDWHMPGS